MSKHDRRENLRLLPSIDSLLQTATAAKIRQQSGAKHLTALARALTGALRREMLDGQDGDKNYSREELLAEAEKNLEKLWRDERNSGLRRVINATGVIVHTNLGRAPLSDEAIKALTENAARYCTVEYDLTTGGRGRRGARVENLLAELTGADDALVVNNCAAAAFLVLSALARGGEAIISRGELVEIGGDFRIPDVLEQSGAGLREVGTTNRTRLSDYERAVSENTKLILRVHPSNYRIIGFTHAPALSELAELAREKDILLYEDAGSGAMFDLSRYGLTDEPVISDSIRAGADVVTFSGDKLLGGVQSGLIVGRGEIIEKIRKHPLYRALRVDKLIYAALEATLESFRSDAAVQEIPVLKMLSATIEQLKTRSSEFAEKLNKNRGANKDLKIEIAEGKSVVGGGSAPMIQPETTLLALKHQKMSAAVLEQRLRFSEPPVIARILEDKVLIDLRTVSVDEEAELLDLLVKLNAD